jgi:predicted nucleic acid-binding protein
MAVVSDANLLVALRTSDARSPTVRQLYSAWAQTGEAVHAPFLAQYEVASGLTRLLAAGAITTDQLDETLRSIAELQIDWHPVADIGRVVAIAGLLQRRSAYDAAYIALAEDLGAELWTLDGPLARNAVSIGFPVRLVPVP